MFQEYRAFVRRSVAASPAPASGPPLAGPGPRHAGEATHRGFTARTGGGKLPVPRGTPGTPMIAVVVPAATIRALAVPATDMARAVNTPWRRSTTPRGEPQGDRPEAVPALAAREAAGG